MIANHIDSWDIWCFIMIWSLSQCVTVEGNILDSLMKITAQIVNSIEFRKKEFNNINMTCFEIMEKLDKKAQTNKNKVEAINYFKEDLVYRYFLLQHFFNKFGVIRRSLAKESIGF